jgi:D-amino-acid dehydrogenase
MSEPRAPDCDIAVIGAGMVGVSCALELAERGLSVTLIDPLDPRGRASFGNAGVISRSSIIPLAGPGVWAKLPGYLMNRDSALRLRYGALPHYLSWGLAFLRRCNADAVREAAAALAPLCAGALPAHMKRAAQLGLEDRIIHRGALKLFRTEEAFAASAGERALLAEHGVMFEVLDSDEITACEPGLTRRFARAMLVPGTSSVNQPGALVEAYATTFTGLGGCILQGKVEALADDGERVTLRWSGGSITARQAILAAGARVDQLLKPLGYRFPLAAERGYHQHFRMAEGRTLNRPIYDAAANCFIAPMGDMVRVTSGVEMARPDDPPNAAQIRAVLPEARGTLALGEPIEAEPWMGSRPSTPDGLPVIGRAARHPNIIFAFGHGHIGLSTGPLTGEIVADIAMQRAPAIPAAPFAAERFG